MVGVVRAGRAVMVVWWFGRETAKGMWHSILATWQRWYVSAVFSGLLALATIVVRRCQVLKSGRMLSWRLLTGGRYYMPDVVSDMRMRRSSYTSAACGCGCMWGVFQTRAVVREVCQNERQRREAFAAVLQLQERAVMESTRRRDRVRAFPCNVEG
ncbi:hypothetical protein OH77DRAFT_335561 [Trametes cingulata]|nr:hypothetical protein OH77DRAFT_335561 [Trametes cingulata]